MSSLQEDDDPGELGGVCLLTAPAVGENVKKPIHYNPKKVAVIIEGDEVVSLPQFSDAVLVLFGLIYALHLDYPQKMANTFFLMVLMVPN